jgi:hypothetical protein
LPSIICLVPFERTLGGNRSGSACPTPSQRLSRLFITGH